MAYPLALLVGLVHAASMQGEVSGRASSFSSTYAPRGLATETAASASVEPRAYLRVDVWRLRLGGTYAPRFWSSDVERQRPLAAHLVLARVETHHEARWRAALEGLLLRSRTDPVADALSAPTAAAQPGGSQVATRRALPYSEQRSDLAAEVPLGARTSAGAAAAWSLARAVAPGDRPLLPTQRTLSGGLTLDRLATERDTIRIGVRGAQVSTYGATGLAQTGTTTGLLTWQRALTPDLQGRLGAGAIVSHAGPYLAARDHQLFASGDAGLSRGSPDAAWSGELSAQLATLVDRYTGQVRPSAVATAVVRWQATERTWLSTSASGTIRLDGDTRLARADARVSWSLGQHLSLEAGLGGRIQVERRQELPSFGELVAFGAVVVGPARVFGVGDDDQEPAP